MTARMVPGELLASVSVPLEPQRSKHKPVIVGGRPSMRPEKAWSDWRAAAVMVLRSQWRGREPIHVPVLVSVVAVFERPKRPRTLYTIGGVDYHYPYPWVSGRVPYVGTPDWDQVGKAAVDVVKQAGILVDDPLVVGVCEPFERWYAADGERPSVSMALWSVVVGQNKEAR